MSTQTVSAPVCVMDASALLALARGERGADVVNDCFETAQCVALSVNLCEVASKLIDLGLPKSELTRALKQFDVDVVDFGFELAVLAAELRESTRSHGLSLGDRACLALAKQMEATAVTADGAWLELEKPLGIKMMMIR